MVYVSVCHYVSIHLVDFLWSMQANIPVPWIPWGWHCSPQILTMEGLVFSISSVCSLHDVVDQDTPRHSSPFPLSELCSRLCAAQTQLFRAP